jgi:2-keto-4-pentenoate hydratase
MNVEARAAAASALATAERERRAIDPITSTFADLDVVDAYEIQLANIRRRVAAGALVKGHKVGLSSRAMQRMMGVHEPDYGHLLDDMFAFESTPVEASRLLYPRVEVEVAFVLGATLPSQGCTVADVLRCTEFVCPALEIIDSRIRDWKIGLVDTISDNASSGLVVLGGRPTPVRKVDIRNLGAVLRRDGAVIATGSSGAVLGNPATAVAWLANKVAAFGVTLEAGHVILPGSCTRAYDIAPGNTFRADFDELGHVTVHFE